MTECAGMAKPKTRRSISVKGLTYQRLKDFCDEHGMSVSGFLEEIIADYDRSGVIRLSVTNRNALTFLPRDPTTGKSLGKGAKWTGEVWLLPHALVRPLQVRKPSMWFVNSISDLAHESILACEEGRRFIAAMFGVMVVTPQHTYQCLTKRAMGLRDLLAWIADQADERGLTEAEFCVLAANEMLRESGDEDLAAAADDLMDRWLWGSQGEYGFEAIDEDDEKDIRRRVAKAKRNFADDIDDEEWPRKNIWLGVSVEDQRAANERIPVLLGVPAAVRFLSCEPLLGPLDLDDENPWLTPLYRASFADLAKRSPDDPLVGRPDPSIDWVIVGGESGPKARPCAIEWIESIVEQCRAASVAVFVKQLGAYPVSEERSVDTVEEAVALFGERARETWPLSRWTWRAALKDAKGGDMGEWPEDLRVREMPEVSP